jgi:hypothetical protein
MAPLVRTQPEEVRRRLIELDVPIETLESAARAGHTGRAMCNEFDPPFIFGMGSVASYAADAPRGFGRDGSLASSRYW